MLITVVDEQNRQTAAFNEDNKTLQATGTQNASVISTEATLHHAEHSTPPPPRLFKPFHVSRNLDVTDVEKQNVSSTHDAKPQTSTASLTLPQSHG